MGSGLKACAHRDDFAGETKHNVWVLGWSFLGGGTYPENGGGAENPSSQADPNHALWVSVVG